MCGVWDMPFSHTPGAVAKRPIVLHHDCSGKEVVKGVGDLSVVAFVAGFDDVCCCVLTCVVMMLSKDRSLYHTPSLFDCVRMNRTFDVSDGVYEFIDLDRRFTKDGYARALKFFKNVLNDS